MKHFKQIIGTGIVSSLLLPAVTPSAWAVATADHSLASSSGLQSLLSSAPMLAVFGFMFYFLLIRPQTQRTKKHQSMLNSLVEGDEVVTIGGLIGRVGALSQSQNDSIVELTLAPDVQIRVKKECIASALKDKNKDKGKD